MKQKKLFLALGLAALFAACSNESDSLDEPVKAPTTALFLNLQSMGYDDLANVLSSTSSFRKDVTLKDGTESWVVQLEQNQKIKIEEEGHNVNLYKGRILDSLSAVLSPDYATLRIQRNGELISYVSYKENNEMEKVANHYLTQFLPTQTRAINEIVTCIYNPQTRSGKSEVSCVKINTTKAIENNPLKGSIKEDCIVNKQDFATSRIATYDDSPFPANVEFRLLKEKDGGALDHEITWQIESTTISLEYLINAGFLTPTYVIRDCPYKGYNNWPESAREEFEIFLRKWNEVSGEGDKIYVLMRDGAWDQGVLGVAMIGLVHYYIPAQNFELSALASSSSLYPNTLAHEIGHLFGALHVDGKEDVMHSPTEGMETAHHLSGDNWDRMLNCWLQKK